MKISEVVRDFFGVNCKWWWLLTILLRFQNDPIYSPIPRVQTLFIPNLPCFGRFTTQVGDDQYYQGILYNTLTTQWCFGRFTTQVREDMYFWKLHD